MPEECHTHPSGGLGGASLHLALGWPEAPSSDDQLHSERQLWGLQVKEGLSPPPHTPDTVNKSKLAPVLLAAGLSEVPKTSSSGLINLFQQLTELKNAVHLPRFYYQRARLRDRQRERCTGARCV